MRGRKVLLDQPIYKRISIPKSIVKDVEHILHDPLRGTVKYGAFGKLVARLLKQWVDEQKKEETP